MFQNITDNFEDVEVNNKEKRKISIKNLFSIQDIVLYAISFMISMVSFNGEFAPFGLAIFAATCSNKIPIVIVYFITCIGTLIGFGVNEFLTYVITTLVFIAITLLFRTKFQDDSRNERQRLGIYLFISTVLVQACKSFFTVFLIYDLLGSLMLGIVVYIFYKIFSNSIVVIKEYKNKKAFTIEEVIGASLLVSIAMYSLNRLQIFGLSLSNIFSIMLILFLGWKNGMLVGSTSGITIGMVLGIIGNGSPVVIASYAISGMVAGILNRFGKIGVIIGFCLGNALLTYVANGNTLPIITIREILIASLGLLLIPKSIVFDVTDIIGKTKYLPVTTNNRLDGEKQTVYKLNSVSETISEIAQSYSDDANTSIQTDEDIKKQTKTSFIDELIINIEDFSENILYEDIIDQNGDILDDIYDFLESEEEISKDDLIKILEKNNSYIVGIGEGNSRNQEAESDIEQIVKAINHTYRINKLNMIWKQKEASNKKVLANQLGRSFKSNIIFSRRFRRGAR